MKIAIFGLGLIGGSIGRSVLQKTDNTVLGFDCDEQVLLKADMLKAFSERGDDKGLIDVDMVISAVKPSTTVSLMEKVCQKLKNGAVVIDTCGTKRKVVAEMERLRIKYPNLSFVGVHPMAGREFSGIEHATCGLFERAYIILTPVHTDIGALTTVKEFFMSIGAEGIEVADANKHDKMIAYTSQLAHIVSSSYIKNPLSKEYVGFSAGSFRDMTRVAKLNPDLWTELFLENSDNLLQAIEDLQKCLANYYDALKNKNDIQLKRMLQEGVDAKNFADNLLRERRKND